MTSNLRDPRTVPIPTRMEHLPLDPRGFPIFRTIQNTDGSYNFLGVVAERITECARKRLCGICGQPLGYWIWFVGGPKSLESRVFSEPPHHRECLDYAITVCPFFNRASYHRVIDRPDRPKEVMHDPLGVPIEGDRIMLYRTRQYRFGIDPNGVPLFRAAPHRGIEWIDRGGTSGEAPAR